MILQSFFPPMIISVLIASIMLIVMVFSIMLFKRDSLPYGKNFSLFLAVEMIGMNLSIYSYIVTGNKVLLLIVSALFMIGGFSLFVKKIGTSVISAGAFSLSLVIAEGAMGALIYSLLHGSPSSFNNAIDSPWFVFVMEAEMIFSIVISYKKMASYKRLYLLVFLLLMPLFPSLYVSDYPIIWLSSIVMIVGTVLIFDTLYRFRMRKGPEVYISMEMIGLFALMMASQFYFFVSGSWLFFDVVMVLAMIWFLFRVFVDPPKRISYLSSRNIAFLLVLLTFVMEWFMGAVLEFNQGQFPHSLGGLITNLSLGWVTPSGILPFIFDVISIIVTVTASVWFLIMMGLEMGFLAFRKIMVSRIRENKVRLGLMISAYAVYSIYIPSFSSLSGSVRYIPYLWSMGIGTNGAVTNGVIVAIAGTYVVSAALSFLFGARQLCSVTCTAPMMYQGTFYDSLKVYNRSTKTGRKTLTSRISNWVKGIILTVNLVILLAAIISYFDSRSIFAWYVYGNDPSYLAYTLMFNLVWYVGFVMSPLMGTYACVNQGWCYWGTFNQLVSRFGFFKLKVRDANACVNCKTVDCALACPVGITDMRKSFIDKGEFKSFKCVGVGDCVEACPYDNIFFYDVRNVIKERILGK